MNKTVSCNISGIIFNLEENAYQILNDYLANLKEHLTNTEGSDEIYSDIEMRIAELFTQMLNKNKQVITEEDVNDVIKILGNPEDYVEKSDHEEQEYEGEQEKTAQNTQEKSYNKVFMRDPENGMIGGVCTGISAYFGIDLTLVRALFVILFFVPGFGAILYIVLWIIAPRAKTSADKLRMRGEPINVKSIKKEVEDAAERVEKYTKRKFNNDKVDTIKKRTSRVGRSLRSIFGLFLIFGASFGIISFLVVTLSNVGFFTTEDGDQLISLYEFSSVIFTSGWQSILGWAGILGAVIIPLLCILIVGVTLLLHIRNQWVKYALTTFMVFWFFAIGALSITGIQLSREFSYLGESEEIIGEVNQQKLVVNIPDLYSNQNASTKVRVNSEAYHSMLELEDNQVKSGFVSLEIVPSKDSLFHINREKSAYGITQRKALRLTANIDHQLNLEGNELTVYPFYHFPAEDKLRAQHVTIYIHVPLHGKIEWKGNKKQLEINEKLD